ncbi:MAG: endonuclease/exonuclease/phosphatase family protein [Bradymonadaceae bacterium]
MSKNLAVWTALTLVSPILVCNGLGCNGPSETEADVPIVDAGIDTGDDAGIDTTRDIASAEDTHVDAMMDAGPDWPEQNMRGAAPLDLSWTMPEAGAESFSVLVANVGNIDITRCTSVAFNLCWVEQEEIIAARIAERDPDVILLQEVLAADQCDAVEDPGEDHICHPSFDPAVPDQVRRLVGDDYTIACDARHGWECIAVKVGVGSIEGCDDGTFCADGARVAPVVDECEPGFTASAVTATIAGRTLDIVNVHPPSNISGPVAGQACRRAYLEYVFGNGDTIVESDLVFVGGDFNMDPYREDEGAPDISYWSEFVGLHYGGEKEFAYHSGIVENDPPYWTSVFSRKTLDHAVSNGLIGRCVTLGAQAGYGPIDDFHGTAIERLDHLALWCRLGFGD